MKRLIYLIAVMALFLGQTAQAAETNCEKYGIISAGDYIIQNNVWGASTAQCITYSGGTSWTVSTSAHNQGSVAGYPSIFKGCHYGTCTPNSGMPILVSNCSSANFSYSVSSTRPSGNYNVAAEAWLSPNTDTSGGYSGGAEIMIVLDYHGMYPAGSQVGTFNGHDVYYASVGWNFVTYVLTGRNSASGNMMDFINDAVSRGYVNRSWYIHVMEAGFEIMSGGQGLSCNSFSFSVSGGGTTTTAGSTTTTAASTTTTAASTTTTAASTSTTSASTSTSTTSASTSTTTTAASTTTTSGGGSCTCDSGCDGSSISPNFTKDGAGQFCWQATSGTYINSWNLNKLEVNNTVYTNQYVFTSSFPAKINGVWYIYYDASVAWGHFELKN